MSFFMNCISVLVGSNNVFLEIELRNHFIIFSKRFFGLILLPEFKKFENEFVNFGVKAFIEVVAEKDFKIDVVELNQV